MLSDDDDVDTSTDTTSSKRQRKNRRGGSENNLRERVAESQSRAKALEAVIDRMKRAMTKQQQDNDLNAQNNLYYKFNLGSFENWEIGILGGSFLDEGVFFKGSSEQISTSLDDNDRFIFNTDDSSLYFVSDGNGSEEAVEIANFDNNDLTNFDIFNGI